jgi:hypothetical protein
MTWLNRRALRLDLTIETSGEAHFGQNSRAMMLSLLASKPCGYGAKPSSCES